MEHNRHTVHKFIYYGLTLNDLLSPPYIYIYSKETTKEENKWNITDTLCTGLSSIENIFPRNLNPILYRFSNKKVFTLFIKKIKINGN